jgi:hypothetical protein
VFLYSSPSILKLYWCRQKALCEDLRFFISTWLSLSRLLISRHIYNMWEWYEDAVYLVK